MTKFWELLERSVIIQGVITLTLIGTIVYMYLKGLEVPDALAQFASLVLGFWFGSKVENTRSVTAIKKIMNGGS